MVVGTTTICQQEWPIFYAVTIKYLCGSCEKRKNVTFFLLDVFLFPLITMVMTSTSASVEANLLTFIVKNLLSEDAIATFVADTELYFT